ncbi:c-type cytochrome [Rhodoplanes sp. Z2-YC6860]|uniref:c-type cytochrome n=1 Tax=Rhodoplanes sp. Z2-YC6860 TaxID=674703 RepID=UPI00078E4C58|nr:cytochrome c [Rhodoplanes sp. Z2-YC6860]AMN43395.1 cytochrome c556 [Rhodoplanes sp. Z2-YC6860]
MKRLVLATAFATLGVATVIAEGDPIAARKALMKENNNQVRIAREMIDGSRPFDLDVARKVFTTFGGVATKGKDLWPDSSKTGESASLPAIWENKTDFEAKLAAFGADAQAAEGKVTDLDSFKAQLREIGKHCGGCHNAYRQKLS